MSFKYQLCTKRNAAVLLVLLLIYLFISANSNRDNWDPETMMAKYDLMIPMQECIIFEIYEIEETAISVLPSNVFCLRATPEYDSMCNWYHHSQKGVFSMSNFEPSLNKDCRLDQHSDHSMFNVPKIVYYVTYDVDELSFMGYLSMMSVHRYIKPWAIYVISDKIPTGTWMSKAQKEFGVKYLDRQRPSWVGDIKLSDTTYTKLLVGLQLLYTNGGLYFDLSMMAVRSFDLLLFHNATIGLTGQYHRVGGDVILARRHLPMIKGWMKGLNNMATNITSLERAAFIRPYMGAKQMPDRIHLESKLFYNPSYNESKLLYTGNHVRWADNYAMKMWPSPSYTFPQSPEDLNQLHNTMGEVLRYIYKRP